MNPRNRIIKRLERDENQVGQSLVIIALLMVTILAFLGLLVDGGRAYEGRRVSQNAADASAYAGARALSTRAGNDSGADSSVLGVIDTFALANGAVSASNVTAYYVDENGAQLAAVGGGSIPSSATGVRVFIRLSFQPFLINLASGGGAAAVGARATAQSGLPTKMDHLMPMTLITTTFTYGVDYGLFGGTTGSGNFQWLTFDCNGNTQDLVDYLTQVKDSGEVNVGDFICGSSGISNASQVAGALDAWLSNPADERIWTIPIYDYCINCTGTNLEYHVKAFALFQFDGYWFANNQCRWAGAGSNPNCHDNSPTMPAQLKACANANAKCLMGMFLKMGKLGHVYYPGPCNNNGVDGCVVGLSQ